MSGIVIVCNSRSERGPLTSVISALPEARVVSGAFPGEPNSAMRLSMEYFQRQLAGAKLVVLLGDRYETLGAALAATFLRIPIAHIHGGETTTGAFDDAFRHSITHLTENSGGLHFCATYKAMLRLQALIGNGERVRMVGSPGLDGVTEYSRDRSGYYKKIVACFMPETRREDYGLSLCGDMLRALEKHTPEYEILFTGVNTDPGSTQIAEMIRAWSGAHANTKIRDDFDRDKYLWHLKHATLCVGNSSSFVIEAPWVGIPTVLVGDRQLGREMADSVFQDDANIGAALGKALRYKERPKPVYRGGAAEKIARACRVFVGEDEVMEAAQ